MTTLDEHRIERMRSVVMEAVDEDVSRRGRRTRVAVRSGAGLCALAVIAGLGVHFTAGHDAPADSTAATGSVVLAPAPQARAPHGSADSAAGGAGDTLDSLSGVVPTGGRIPDSGQMPSAAPARAGDPAGAAQPGRSIVTTGSAHVVTTTPLNTADQFISWVESGQGYVAGQSDTGTGSTARLTLTVRVPDQESAITRLRALGKVDQVETDSDDVTTQATDLDARIKESRISITRLEAILSRTTSVRDVLSAESVLTTRQQQLESMIQQQKKLGDQVALATLTVSFTAKQPLKVETVTHRPDWFHRTVIHKFDKGATAVLDVVAFLLPWLVLAGLIALLWAGVVRLTRRRG